MICTAGCQRLLLALLLYAPGLWAELQLDLQRLQWGEIRIESVQFHQTDARQPPPGPDSVRAPLWRLQLQGVALAEAVQLDVLLTCRQAAAQPTAPASGSLGRLLDSGLPVAGMPDSLPTVLRACADGVIELRVPLTDLQVAGRFSYDLARAVLQLELPTVTFDLQADASWSLRLQRTPLHWLQQVVDVSALATTLARWTGLDTQQTQRMPWPRQGMVDAVLSGQLPRAGEGTAGKPAWQLELALEQLAFDNVSGDIAADGVQLQLQASAGLVADQRWDFAADLQWLAGEWLLAAFYLPPPQQAVRFAVAGSWQQGSDAGAAALRLDRLQWLHEGVGELLASASWQWSAASQNPAAEQSAPAVAMLPSAWRLEQLQVALPAFQQAYLNGWLQTHNLADSIRSGNVRMQSVGGQGTTGLQHATQLVISELDLLDPGARLAASGLHADIHWRYRQAEESEPATSRLGWDSLRVGRLPVAATALAFELSDAQLQLQRDSLIPVLDGGILLHDLHLERMFADDAELVLDGEIVPVSLRQLGQVMGWPEFGGQISGSIPGIRREQGVWALNGQIELALFQGRAVISGLRLERPFGVLPVLQAGIWVERLQLEPLTAAFDIGRITGPVDAYVRDLRLLNWQPVSFDAWLRTSTRPQVPLRISQRAVDTLSSVGGGIGSGLQASVLRLFESFRYQQLGVSCRLGNGVCQMDGIDHAADGNGFVLVKGGGLPHLDVVAYNRQVDWQRLLTQLRAAIESQGAKVR
ncbi:MAG: hypothetical protein KKC01_13545 [Gammaproteobacteria bacterium]|nr:hypothetical protein [Gammaproteobacteria bacterium]